MPVCIAGVDTSEIITAEPAIVLDLEASENVVDAENQVADAVMRQRKQNGASLRRVTRSLRNLGPQANGVLLDDITEDEANGVDRKDE